jgi:hypothetical protein
MMLRTLGGVLAAAFCGAALLGAPAQAATIDKTAAAVPAMTSDCWYSHSYDGYWHHHARYVCDDDDYDGDYYDGGYYPGYDYGGGYYGGHGGHFGGHGGHFGGRGR